MVLVEEQAVQERVVAPATILLCAWRNIVVDTAECLIRLRENGWGYVIKRGDALITRQRAKVVSDWYRQTDEDVFLMIDDDVVFTEEHAAKVVQLARDTRSIACAAYVVKDGGHLACRRLPNQDILFGQDENGHDSPPVEILYPATGFMAVHRDVIDAMVAAKTPDGEPVFPYCDALGDDGAYWPFFDVFSIKWDNGRWENLSEDYAFGEQAQRLGFKVWLDPSVILFHMGTFPYNVRDMKRVMNLCGNCNQVIDREGRGHRLDCAVHQQTVELETARGHKLLFDASDSIITESVRRTGVWEESVASAIETYLEPGWTFVDIGAHVGYFSTIAASKGAEVIAIEANPIYADLLKQNCPQAEVHAVAVSDREGTSHLSPDARFTAHPSAAGLSDSGIVVHTKHLRSILDGRYPQFIKADIEGMEHAVFCDSPLVLDKAQVVVFEVSPTTCDRYGTTVGALVAMMQSFGFVVTYMNGSPLDEHVDTLRPDQYLNLLARRVA